MGPRGFELEGSPAATLPGSAAGVVSQFTRVFDVNKKKTKEA